MRVLLVTIHRVYNYGSVLQTYATQKVFEKLNCQVEVLDYITPQRTFKRILLNCPDDLKNNRIKRFVYIILKFPSMLLKKITFGKFINKYLKLTKKYITVDDIKKDCPVADIYVTGSDQTWNSKYNEGIDEGYFLNFGDMDSKRISFVASFGKDKLDDFETEKTKEYLSKYTALSVRENSAVKILNSLGFENVKWLIDPTLQISKEEWKYLASKRLVKKKYLILMLLYNEDNNASKYARKIADMKGLELVKISWELKKADYVDILFTHRTPNDFLSLFYYADFVVTNSFHGLAFAINFNRQFIVVPREEFNSRIMSLLELTNLLNRLTDSDSILEKNIKEIIDFGSVNEVLEEERKKAKEFIIENII
ncbi:polysaccharide pyruvyl transferase family protein [Thomasclavelia saccharogumia]|uniref:polysaccharide pyruvyl transferase family protein n=1 Tax=Thomasclavelia saccharogumia TaxID=341225 RepID=UPI00047D06B7|nr:polysaccharide pyruvyl transferase family protein [Thomasclavelia saccharogumia]